MYSCVHVPLLELLWVNILLPGYPLTNNRRVPVYWVQRVLTENFSALNQDQFSEKRQFLNGYLGSIFITRVVLLPVGTRVPGYQFTALPSIMICV